MRRCRLAWGTTLTYHPDPTVRIEPLVLVIERDSALREVLALLLSELGYRSRLLTDIHQVGAAVRVEPVTAVIAGTWGPSRARLLDVERSQIRDLASLAPLILLSGAAWTTAVRPSELGVRCILEHPLDIDLLEAELLRCLNADGGGSTPRSPTAQAN